MKYKLTSEFKPTGDQPEAIEQLVNGINEDSKFQVLQGVTGSGKTFTIANVIEKLNRPVLVLSHNKTLAAQLYGEFKQFFPDNAVEYFVSYYDYYQPEAYLPVTNTYIEKDLSINDEIEKLRLSTTTALLSGRRDIIVVSSVSCLYGIGNPDDFHESVIHIEQGQKIARNKFLRDLVTALYSRDEINFDRGKFRVKGDTVDIFLAYVTTKERMQQAVSQIQDDLFQQIQFFKDIGKPLEAKRIEDRVTFDLEMIKELGHCPGIENYSRYFDGREAGTRPFCLLDFFAKDYLTIIDESHVTLPQVRAMYGGDHSRKGNLVEYGFRLPAAIDNRPLKFEEFEAITNQTIYLSATPADYELNKCEGIIVEQVIRPTGLIDPTIDVRPSLNQIDDLIGEINERVAKNERILVTTLTKRMAEELTTYLSKINILCRYIHSDVETLERVEIMENLRKGTFDVLIGVNLLREGLDLPEVSLVAIIDADKEGFLRSEKSLTQTAGRAARNLNGKVIMYADKITGSMQRTIDATNLRREKQLKYNQENNITPRQIKKATTSILGSGTKTKENIYINDNIPSIAADPVVQYMDEDALVKTIEKTKKTMKKAAKELDFIEAARLRDEMYELEKLLKEKKS
ncbi:MAG: excinuclease ABC subunit B [Bacteroidetes bacterium 4572_117]|nr:MAG: excinuclease ABC subunit B [Bacteroidetes bacterium 4572_117]